MPRALCFHALLPSPACPFLLKTSRDGAASPSPGGGYQHVSFTPVNPFPSAFCCLPRPASPAPLWGACPSAPPASSLLLATLPLLLACSPFFQAQCPKLELRKDQLTCPACPSLARALPYVTFATAGHCWQVSEVFSCKYPCSIIPVSFPSPGILPPSSLKCILFISDRVSHLSQIKGPAQIFLACCRGNSPANYRCHTNTHRSKNQLRAYSAQCGRSGEVSFWDWVTPQHANQGLEVISEKLDTGQAWEAPWLKLFLFPRTWPCYSS